MSFRSDSSTEVTVCTITDSSLCAGISTVTAGGGSASFAWSGRSFSMIARIPIISARPLTSTMPRMNTVAIANRDHWKIPKITPSARATIRSRNVSGTITSARVWPSRSETDVSSIALGAQLVNDHAEGPPLFARDPRRRRAAEQCCRSSPAASRPRRFLPPDAAACSRRSANRPDRFFCPTMM